MNLLKLYEMQKKLRERINYNDSDRFEKLKLALLVELGECCNEQKACFKFWKKNPVPNTHASRNTYIDIEDAEFYNPLLEEFVDGLHFILELGLELGFHPEAVGTYKYPSVTEQFNELFWSVTHLHNTLSDYVAMFARFVGLGEMLGFKWEQVESAYYEKNKINHIRQDTGY